MDGLEEAHDVLIRIIQDVRRTDRPQFTLLERIEKRLGFDLGSIFQVYKLNFHWKTYDRVNYLLGSRG